tara:strand:+ start:13296 stop:14246 length:951 start_codon:yes stop_codon:yes gene_type:complete
MIAKSVGEQMGVQGCSQGGNMLHLLLALGAGTLSLSVAQASDTNFIEQILEPKVIYGEDDRQDLYELNDPYRITMAESTVALVKAYKVQGHGERYFLKGSNYQKAYGLCETERFIEQDISSYCTGALIDKDKVLTAGHCVRNKCGSEKYVFDYNKKTKYKDAYEIPASSVYSCKKVLHRSLEGGKDFAIVQLDRQVLDREPLSVYRGQDLPNKTSVYVMSYLAGLPLKYSGDAYIRDNQPQHFYIVNTDTYGGSSGAPVFDEITNEIIGILSSGEMDFVAEPGSACQVSQRCAMDACRGEFVTKMTSILDATNGDL